MVEKILVTGSTGLIGSELRDQLSLKGIVVHELSRSKHDRDNTFTWDVASGQIDPDSLEGVSAMVHLAGAGIADEKWTKKRKEELFDSRIESTRLLYETLKKSPGHKVNTLICASAIGYYGFDRGDELVNEESSPGNDFLANITTQWEKEASKFEELGIRVVMLRIGIVLSTEGGALVEMMRPVKWMAGAALGNGKQFMSWIHIEDMAGIILYALENEKISGVFNSVSPNPETNKEFTRLLARVMKKPFFLPPVPGFVLRTILGEMAVLVLGGLKVSSEKIKSSGFSFKFPRLKDALEDLIN